MKACDLRRAVATGMASASALGLRVDDAAVLQSSNRIALRLLPCDVLARVAPVEHRAAAEFEVMIARRLGETDGPIAQLEARVEPLVYVRDGFAVTFWTYHESAAWGPPPAEYAQALVRLHAGMRQAEVSVPHFSERVAEAQRLIDDVDLTPELPDADRTLLGHTLRSMSRTIDGHGAPEQLLHGEPHPGNLLVTKNGLLFVDLETCCRGPVEFDVAHTPEEVSGAYPLLNEQLLRACRVLALALATTWRWDRYDRLPNGHRLATEWTSQIRAALDGYGPEVSA